MDCAQRSKGTKPKAHSVLLTPRRSSVAGASDAVGAAASRATDVAPSLSENVRWPLALGRRKKFAR